jgi:hypothetical protein
MNLEQIDTMIGFAVIMLMFSLLITVLVQMANSLFDLRGKNLLWGVQQLLEHMDPGLKTHAAELARRIVTHPALAPWSRISYRKSGEARATAIRPEELVKVLKDLAVQGPGLSPEARTAITNLIGSGMPGATPEVIAQIEKAAGELARVLPDQAAIVTSAFTRLRTDLATVEGKVSTWFDTIMDRTSERFLYQMRVTTASASFLFAFFLHVDSLQIIRRVGENHELRAQLVHLADPTLARADTVLGLVGRGKPSGVGILREMRRADSTGMPADSIPASLTSREAGRAWLAATVRDSARRVALQASYDGRFAAADTLWLRQLQWAAEGIDSTLKATSFSPVPSPVPSIAAYVSPGLPYLNGHFLGVLMSAMLLSLGAPFWYNALRTMANLRPVVAQKLTDEAQEK